MQLNRLFADPGVAASGGAVYLVHPNHAAVQHQIGIISALAEQYDVRQDLLDKLPPDGAGRLWTLRMMGANMAYRRQPLLAVGGFDEFYEWVYDDSDLAVRLAAAGYFVQPAMEACVYHVPASSRNRVAYTTTGAGGSRPRQLSILRSGTAGQQACPGKPSCKGSAILYMATGSGISTCFSTAR